MKLRLSLVILSLILIYQSAWAAVCPNVADLVPPDMNAKDQRMFWYAPGGWKSNTSFETQVTQYLGAQWTGAVVGVVICIYQTAGNTNFPLTLQNNKLMQAPTGGRWIVSQEKKQDPTTQAIQNISNCVSTDPNDCPFIDAADPNANLQNAPLSQQIPKQTPWSLDSLNTQAQPEADAEGMKYQALDKFINNSNKTNTDAKSATSISTQPANNNTVAPTTSSSTTTNTAPATPAATTTPNAAPSQ